MPFLFVEKENKILNLSRYQKIWIEPRNDAAYLQAATGAENPTSIFRGTQDQCEIVLKAICDQLFDEKPNLLHISDGIFRRREDY